MAYRIHSFALFVVLLVLTGLIACSHVTPTAITPTSPVAPTSTLVPTHPSVTLAPTGDQAVALVNGTLIDGTGDAPLHEAVVVIHQGRIAAVGPRAQVELPEGAQVID